MQKTDTSAPERKGKRCGGRRGTGLPNACLPGEMRGSERGNARLPQPRTRGPPPVSSPQPREPRQPSLTAFSTPRLAAGSPAGTAAPHAGPAQGHPASARWTGPGVAGAPGPRARRRSSSGPLSRRAAGWAVFLHRPPPPEPRFAEPLQPRNRPPESPGSSAPALATAAG